MAAFRSKTRSARAKIARRAPAGMRRPFPDDGVPAKSSLLVSILQEAKPG
jgi:hypothetical protein